MNATNRLPQAGDRVKVIATDELGIAVPDVAPNMRADGEWEFFIMLDADAAGRRWRGWWAAHELVVIESSPGGASDPDAYIDEPAELDPAAEAAGWRAMLEGVGPEVWS